MKVDKELQEAIDNGLKTAQMKIRCTPQEIADWKEAARQRGVTLSTLVRWALGKDEYARKPNCARIGLTDAGVPFCMHGEMKGKSGSWECKQKKRARQKSWYYENDGRHKSLIAARERNNKKDSEKIRQLVELLPPHLQEAIDSVTQV